MNVNDVSLAFLGFFCLHIHHSTVWVHTIKDVPIKFDETKMFYLLQLIPNSVDGQNKMKLSPSHLTMLKFHQMSSAGHC